MKLTTKVYEHKEINKRPETFETYVSSYMEQLHP